MFTGLVQDLGRIVDEVEHVRRVLSRIGTIESRQRLHRLDPAQHLVHVHAAQQRLVEARLELIGN
jgi:hypothetical protein